MKTNEPLTQNIQDYLKAIYSLTENDGPASTTALAARLGIKAGSVTGMIQKLATSNPPLVIYSKHQGVTLTSEGERAALEVIRHHRLLEAYLVEMLGYSWDEVHAEADRLEHVISEDFEARIAAALGNPLRDPHGELIPTVELTMPTDADLPLSALRPPQKAHILRVRSDDPQLLRHLESLGLIPGAQVEALEYSSFDQNLSLRVGQSENPTVIGSAISSRIFIHMALTTRAV
jgi:DtxR family transcriptional regulator, Mn-dependent transcriptional regulator